MLWQITSAVIMGLRFLARLNNSFSKLEQVCIGSYGLNVDSRSNNAEAMFFINEYVSVTSTQSEQGFLSELKL